MISATLRPPAMGETRQLAAEELQAFQDGKKMKRLLRDLRFGCFKDSRGYYWLGAAAPDFPDHTRWVLVIEQTALQATRSWSKVAYESLIYGVPQVVEFKDLPEGYELEPTTNPLGMLQDLLIVIRGAVSVVHNRPFKVQSGGLDESYFELQSHAVQAWQTFGYPGLASTPSLLRLPWGQDGHDLIHHYDCWSVRHPEFASLPHELALRMHGFGIYADWLVGESPEGNWIESRAHCSLV